MLLKVGEKESNKVVSVLTKEERRKKIAKFLEKRKRRIWNKKVSYDCRKKVADKRLRIKGRFVTREQAYALLGTIQEDLLKNKNIIELIKANSDCSIVASTQSMKVRNIQTLIDHHPKDIAKESRSDKKLAVEIVKEDRKNQVVEIKIDQADEEREGRKATFVCKRMPIAKR